MTRPDPYNTAYTGAPQRRPDPYVSACALHAARILYVFGGPPFAPRGPAAFGAGVPVPDRRALHGYVIGQQGRVR